MNILAFFAHPDDETMLAGGTLALLARQGAAVHYVCATRGEGGEAGDPPLCLQDDLGQVREQELACAVNALGGASLDFLGYLDPLIGPGDTLYAFEAVLEDLVEQLQSLIRQYNVQAVLTHGATGEYGHPGHRLVNQAAALAVASLPDGQPALYIVQAAFLGHPKPRLMNKDESAHIVLDVSPVLPAKIQAALCHRTQHALFVRRASLEAGRQLAVPEVIVALESLHRAFPPATGPLDDPLAGLLYHSGCVREDYQAA